MAIRPINIPYFPTNRYPVSNITPLTYRDGITYLEKLQRISWWIREKLIPAINDQFGDFGAEFETIINELIDQVNTVVNKIIDDSVDLQDPVMAEIINNLNSETRQALDALYELPNLDPIVAGYIRNIDSATREALDEIFQKRETLYYNASEYGYVGNGGDETAVIQGLINTVPEGATIKLPEGTSFTTTGLVIDQKGLTLDMSNTHATLTTSAPFVQANGEWETNRAVASVEGGTVSVPTVGLKADDMVKLIARDEIWDARPHDETGQTPRVGEWAVIKNIVDDNTLVINPWTVDAFTTDVKLCVPVPHKVVVKFGTLTDAGPKGAPFKRRLISFVGLIHPELSGEIISGKGIACEARNCYGGDFDIKFTGLPFTDGYGITLSGSVACRVKVNGERSRHAFTDNPAGYGYTSSPNEQGRAMFNVVYDSIVFSGHSSAFDTHHGSYGEKFINCHVIGSTSDGIGFSLRGTYHTYVGCSASRIGIGFRVYNETREGADQWASSHGHTLNGCSTQLVDTAIASDIVVRRANRPDNLTISGGRYEFGAGGFIRAQRSLISLKGVSAYMRSGGTNGGNAIIFGTSYDVVGDLTLDATNLTNWIVGIIACTPGSSTETAWLLDVVLISGEGVDNFNNLVNWGPARGRLNVRSKGKVYTGSVSNASTPGRSATYISAGGGASSAIIRTTRNTAGTEVSFSAADPHVTVLITGNGSGVALGAFAAGRFPGQVVTIVSYQADRNVRIVNDPALGTMIGSDIVIGGFESASLVWTGDYWIRA